MTNTKNHQSSDQLKHFILVNGYEIIGKLIETNSDSFKLDQPLGLHVVPQRDNETYGIQLVPFSAVNPDSDHLIYKTAIASEVCTIPVDIEKAYRQRTSRIQLL